MSSGPTNKRAGHNRQAQQRRRRARGHGAKSPARGAATMPIASIKIGHRHRRDLGDLAGLAASIEDIGLLHPVTVDEQGRLLAGVRRLAACKLLGRKGIPVNVVRGAR